MRKKCAYALIGATGVAGVSAHQKNRRGTLGDPFDTVGKGNSNIKSLRESIIVRMSQWESEQPVVAEKWM
jgi:hypothetical protein